jgi:hypothetical protein
MAVTDVHGNDADEDRRSVPLVSALRTSPERIVFTEDGNSDGWIATDHATELRP